MMLFLLLLFFFFLQCSKTCNGGVRVRSITCQLSGQQSQACNVSTMPLSFELCNTRDCPGGMSNI